MSISEQIFAGQRVGLVDAIDRLLDKGVVVVGDATVALADVDLVYVKLGLMLASVERLRLEGRSAPPAGGARPVTGAGDDGGPSTGNRSTFPERPAEKQSMLPGSERSVSLPERVPDDARDLARLVLTLVDLLRRVLERQALHRMEGEGLSEEDTERMGLALMELDARMDGLCEAFGIRREELEIDLGPLGTID